MIGYKNRALYVENVPVAAIAQKAGTPLFIYSGGKILENFRAFDRAYAGVPHLICYALKANSNLGVARLLAKAGAGVDIVSAGELFRALKAGFHPKKIVFSGVGKTREEMAYALKTGIRIFNVESQEELRALNQVAGQLKKRAPISIRVNPDVAADTHHHITTGTAENKFGIHKKYILDAYALAQSLPHIEIVGLQAHIGSQITTVAPFVSLLKVLLGLIDELAHRGILLRTLDMGGGLGIDYKGETPPTPSQIARALLPNLKGRDLTLLFEPGRYMVGEAGLLVTRVLYRKETTKKTFVIVDAAMNDLARPALYDAYHEIVPVLKNGSASKVVDVVGPVCESGDYFAKGRKIPFPENGALLAIENSGAYGFSMSSQYNSRPRAAEVLVEGSKWRVVRARETLKDLIRGEN